MRNPIVPCIWLDDQAEAAAALYTATFPASRTTATSHYPEDADNPAGKPRGSLLTVEVELAGQRVTLLDGGPMFKPNPSVSFLVQREEVAEVDRIFAALAEGGQVMMALDKYDWSPRYGWCADRFGVSWQVMASAERPRSTISTSLMFTGAVDGRAEEAIRAYTSIFPGGEIVRLQRYEKGEGREGAIKHGHFVLAGQDLTAMDGGPTHEFGFDEGMSLQVMCADQAEIDRFWDQLAEGGSHSVCGWLKDRFGLSWQVVPAQIGEWLTSRDTAARDRAFAAMMTMTKPDLAALDRAFRGTAR